MDTYLLHYIRRYIGRNRALDRFFIHVSHRGPRWFFVVLGVVALLGGYESRVAVLEALAAATVTRGLNELIGRIWPRERPFVREGFPPLIEHRPSFSFPSNHAACSFALAVPVWLHLPGVGTLLLVMAGVLALARIFVGVHYPLDVLIGALVGSLVAFVTDSFIW